MFSRFDTIPACDGRTNGQTDRRTDVKPIAITCFSIADARKNLRAIHVASIKVKFSDVFPAKFHIDRFRGVGFRPPKS